MFDKDPLTALQAVSAAQWLAFAPLAFQATAVMRDDLPGLDDGVFYLPESSEPTERLVLIHAGAPLDRAAVLAWLRERLDPAFLPRAFIHVDALPRSGPGKLARAALDAIYAQWVTQRRTP